jgi:hypothetical protein
MTLLREELERMPLQLYAQLVTLTHVAWRTLGHGMLYFCQRMPGELGRFRWVIDAKGESVTPQEEWWRVCVKPLLQTRSIRDPLPRLKSGDYSAFARNFPRKPVPDYLRERLRPGTRTVGDLTAVFAEMESGH